MLNKTFLSENDYIFKSLKLQQFMDTNAAAVITFGSDAMTVKSLE